MRATSDLMVTYGNKVTPATTYARREVLSREYFYLREFLCLFLLLLCAHVVICTPLDLLDATILLHSKCYLVTPSLRTRGSLEEVNIFPCRVDQSEAVGIREANRFRCPTGSQGDSFTRTLMKFVARSTFE